ncbi:DUF3048 domain-containing protein [Patescibacteria group bacterium]
MNKKKLTIFLAGLGIYLLSTGLSYAAFTSLRGGGIFTSPLPSEQKDEDAASKDRKALVELSGSQTEACPLNGKKFTKIEKNIWESRRPLAVMIENHQESRPQSGLSDADIIYEAVAEGGITRFMAIFYCQAAAFEPTLGPVRSARTYFVDWASEYNYPLYTHVGGANTPGPANALGQISSYGWSGANDLNQFSIGYPTFWRDYERLGHTVATEHTMYSTTEKLWAIAEKRDFTNEDPDGEEWEDGFEPWSFAKDEAGSEDRGDTQTIDYKFWDYEEYQVSWQYDKEANLYKRSNGGQSHLDLNVNQQLVAKNLVVQFATEAKANDGYPGNVHLLYGTKGKGKIIFFKDGQVEKGTWSKASRIARTTFYDSKGKEIKFNPGRIWISVLPVGTDVDY